MIQVPAHLTGKALIKWLVANKAELIVAKKSATKFTDVTVIQPTWAKDTGLAAKGKYLYEDNVDKGILKRTIVANTYLWLDSHSDVHLENVFASSIAQKVAKPAPHLLEHNFSILAKVGRPISYREQDMSWRELGQGKTGRTMVLLLESEILKSYNEQIYNEYLDGQIDQHSVKMRYIKLGLAVNDPENYPNEYKIWEEIYPKLGNRSKADGQGYFWAISEAELFETSAVLAGSNELTPTLNNKSKEVDELTKSFQNGELTVNEYIEELSKHRTEPDKSIPEVKPRKALDTSKILSNYLN